MDTVLGLSLALRGCGDRFRDASTLLYTPDEQNDDHTPQFVLPTASPEH